MDTNLIFLIITVILFIAILIFDFAFFRFRERKFDDDEPLTFLTQNTLRSLRIWLNTLQQQNLESDSSQSEIDQSEMDFVLPETQQDAVKQTASLDRFVVAPAERPTVHVNITADVPEGTIVHITMQVTDADGKVLIPNSVLTGKTSAPTHKTAPTRKPNFMAWLVGVIYKLKNEGKLNLILFWGSIISYAIIISFAIDKWPIYFFTDEAIHMNMIAYFLKNGFQNYDGEFLPTFFIKEGWVNGTSVYVQLLPYLIFGKSMIVTRLVSAFITLFGAVAIGLLLKKVFKTKYYWAGLFLLLTTPAWFLHARTAFEYAELGSFYCMFLYFYGRYRKGDLRSLYLAIFAAALCFYTHGLGQILTGVTGLALFIVDFRYHIHPKRRITILIGLALAIILLLPFARYYVANPTEIAEQVKRRNSYWSNPALSTPEKILEFLGQYFYGLNPIYWYFPNDIDFDRHIMVGLGGNGLLVALPFVVVGFFQIFKTIRNLAHRLGIIALITAGPILLSTFIHTFIESRTWRTMLIFPQMGPGNLIPIDPSSFIPVEIVINLLWVALALMLVGLFLAFTKIRNPAHKLALIALLACPIPASVVAIGMPRTLWVSVPLAILAAIGLSAVVEWVGKHRQLKPAYSAVGLFAALVLLSVFVLRTALVEGPLWFQDYGLYGMQFGAKQVFQDTVAPALKNNPNVNFVVSPSWANGTEQFTEFFIPEEFLPRVRMGQPENFIYEPDVFTNTQFVVTSAEFTALLQDPKFNRDINMINTINYPNGSPGFYIVSLKPADNIAEIMANQQAQNRNPIEDTMIFNNETIRVVHSPIGSGSMELIFDEDPESVTRVAEANPFFIALYPLAPIDTHSVFIKTGSLHNYTVTFRLYPPGGGEPTEYTQTYQDEPGKDLPPDPEQTIIFDRGPDKAEWVEIEVKDNTSGETSSIHIRTIQFK